MLTSAYVRRDLVLVTATAVLLSTFFSSPALAVPTQKPQASAAIPGEVIVKFREHVASRAIGTDAKAEKAHAKANAKILKRLDRLRMHLVRGNKGQSTAELVNAYLALPEVEYAEPNYHIQINNHTSLLPNDAQFAAQWALRNIGQNGGAQGADIDAPLAWTHSTGNDAVVVAAIDSGVAYNHPDLAANMWRNPREIAGNRIDDDGNGYIDDMYGWNFAANSANPFDDHGHGTHTAGTLGAVGNNAIGVTGVAWKVKIMALKFLSAKGGGGTFEAAQAIDYASRMGARVANASWGGPLYSRTIDDAIRLAGERGMLLVTAAGNEGLNNDASSSFPCNSAQPNVICVAATDPNDLRASFSNYGATNVDIAAPGVNILSTVPTGGCDMCAASGYRHASGTSMASPVVSGAAALVLAHNSRLTPTEVKSLLLNSVDRVGSLQGVVASGRLNIATAIADGFVISALKSELSATAGGGGSLSIDLRSLDGTPRNVSLALNGPAGISMAPLAVAVPASGIAVATLRTQVAAGVAAGTYKVMLVATDRTTGEMHDLPLNVIVSGPPTATGSAADLVISQVSISASVAAGASATLIYNVANRGGVFSSGFYVGLYLSRDARIDSSDRYVGRQWIPRLPANGMAAYRTLVLIPSGTVRGTYHIGAIADVYDAIPETDNANNAAMSNVLRVY